MKKINVLIVFLVVAAMGHGQEIGDKRHDVQDATGKMMDYISFGDTIDMQNAVSDTELSRQYANMATADTISTKFRATVTDVCKVKGCWMKLQLPDSREAMVRFRDYGFFVPKDIEGREVVVSGKAFVEEMSVEDRKHYAKDAGLSEAEIAGITEPQKTFGFEADGVLLLKK